MADNFNLRAFLTENKLTKNAQLLKEEVSLNGKPVHVGSIEIDGIDTNDYPDFVDAYIVAADFEDGTPLTDDEVQQFQDENYDLVGELIHDRQLYLEGEKEEVPENPEDYTKQPGYVHETLTTKERRLVEMVNSAMREEEEGNTFFRTDKDDQIPNPPAELHIPKELTSEEEMVQDKPLPEYNSIEELMKEIEHGTNEAAHKYKMDEMKRVYEALEAKVGSLEEGEHAEHIDQKAVKQMRKDIAALRKAEEKLRKEFDKKFSGKEKKETPAKEKAVEALQEGTFDLRKFLVENKLTASSRMLSEEVNPIVEDIAGAFHEAGIDMEAPTQVVVMDWSGLIEELEDFNTGEEALRYVVKEMPRYSNGQQPEIQVGDEIDPHEDLDKQPKLNLQFGDLDSEDDVTDAWSIGIIQ